MDYLTGSPVPEPIRHQSIHPVIVGWEEPFGRERGGEGGLIKRTSGIEGERGSQYSSGSKGGEIKHRLDVRVVSSGGERG